MACGGKQSVHKSSAPIDRSANDQRERAQIAREGPRWGNGIEGTAARLCGMPWRGYCVHWCIDWWRLNRQSNARYTFASIDPSAMWVDRIGFVTTTTTTTTTCQLGWHLHSCASCRPLDRLTDCLTALAGRPASNPTPLSIVSLEVITPWRGSVTLTYVLSRLVSSCLVLARRGDAMQSCIEGEIESFMQSGADNLHVNRLTNVANFGAIQWRTMSIMINVCFWQPFDSCCISRQATRQQAAGSWQQYQLHHPGGGCGPLNRTAHKFCIIKSCLIDRSDRVDRVDRFWGLAAACPAACQSQMPRARAHDSPVAVGLVRAIQC